MQNSMLKCTKSHVVKDVADLEYELQFKKDKGNTTETMQILTLLERK